jgi:hypothetical protein
MYNPYEDFGELLEDGETDESYFAFESDEADFEADERARRSRMQRPAPRRVNTAPRGNTVPRPSPQGYATKAELQQTAARIDAKIATNSKAVQTLDGRVRGIITENGRISAALAKEIRERKTATDALKKSIDEQRQIAMLLPLLSTYEKRTVDGVENVLVDSGDKLSSLLPILLMSGGFGGSTGSGGGGLFGGDNSMATMAMVIALSDK